MKTQKISLSIILIAISLNMSFNINSYYANTAHSTEPPQKQTVCPVMGGEINPNYYADVEGKRIYVCCPGCIGAVKKNPSKYISQLEENGIALEDIPKTEMKR